MIGLETPENALSPETAKYCDLLGRAIEVGAHCSRELLALSRKYLLIGSLSTLSEVKFKTLGFVLKLNFLFLVRLPLPY